MGAATRNIRNIENNRGLTLVEMVLALAVMGLVAASIATIFGAASDLVEKNRERIELVQTGRTTMNRLLAELQATKVIEARSANYLRVFCSGITSDGSFARRVEFWASGGTLWRRVIGDQRQVLAEDVNSFETGGLTLWSKLDSSLDVTNPQVGPGGGLWLTSAWMPGIFGTAYWSAPGTDRHVYFPTAGVLDDEQGTLEFWCRPEFSAEWRGLDKDKYLVDTYGSSGTIQLFFDHSACELKFRVNGKELKWVPTWAPHQWAHIALVWDNTGRRIGEGRTLALYVNGLRREASAQTEAWSLQGLGPFFSLGRAETADAEAAFDNLRAYDYCKTDFADRYREDGLGLLRVRLELKDEATGDTVTIENGVLVQ